MYGTQTVDPALYVYVGVHFTCVLGNQSTDKDMPKGHKTHCRILSVNLVDNPTIFKYKDTTT